MEELLNEIERALQAQLWYMAFYSSLTLPDLCAAAQAENNRTTGERYKRWCEAWFDRAEVDLSPSDLWELRCAVLHQGQVRITQGDFQTPRQALFVSPPFGIHNLRITTYQGGEEAFVLMIDLFCLALISAVRRWHTSEGKKPLIMRNLSRFIQKRPEGKPPFLGNIPVIY